VVLAAAFSLVVEFAVVLAAAFSLVVE
jgi:hypothetical protein